MQFPGSCVIVLNETTSTVYCNSMGSEYSNTLSEKQRVQRLRSRGERTVLHVANYPGNET